MLPGAAPTLLPGGPDVPLLGSGGFAVATSGASLRRLS